MTDTPSNATSDAPASSALTDRPARQIYRYSNGVRTVAADPAVLWRRINTACVAAGTTWVDLCKRWQEFATPTGLDDTVAADYDRVAYLEFQGLMTEVVREAFGLSPLDHDGDGMTENEVMQVLADFLDYREKKGPSTESSPSSSAPTGGESPALVASWKRPSGRSPTTTSTG